MGIIKAGKKGLALENLKSCMKLKIDLCVERTSGCTYIFYPEGLKEIFLKNH